MSYKYTLCLTSICYLFSFYICLLTCMYINHMCALPETSFGESVGQCSGPKEDVWCGGGESGEDRHYLWVNRDGCQQI